MTANTERGTPIIDRGDAVNLASNLSRLGYSGVTKVGTKKLAEAVLRMDETIRTLERESADLRQQLAALQDTFDQQCRMTASYERQLADERRRVVEAVIAIAESHLAGDHAGMLDDFRALAADPQQAEQNAEPATVEVEVIDPYVMDLVRKHGSTMTNSEIVRKFLPKQRIAAPSALTAADSVVVSSACRICGCVAPHSHNPPDENGHYHWIAVDLDGTLAEGVKHIDPMAVGAPIPHMIERVKDWLRDGVEVRIFTARTSLGKDSRDIYAVTVAVQDWCEKHIGHRLPVTNIKQHGVIELWDDRAINPVRVNKEVDGLLALLVKEKKRNEAGVVVPREPTRAMLDAMHSVFTGGYRNGLLPEAYHALLTAASAKEPK